MRAEIEGPDADASGISNARALASLVACLAALNVPAEPTIVEQPAQVVLPRQRLRLGQLPLSYRLAAPMLALVMVFVATPSLADREFALWRATALFVSGR